MLRVGEVIDGRFEVEHALARSVTSTVHRARDRQSGRPVAVKVLEAAEVVAGEVRAAPVADPTRVVRLSREATLLASVRHPNVARYLAHGLLGSGVPYLVTEWIDGPTLAQRLAEGPLSVDDTRVLGARVAEALREVHSRGIVHRDVKPQNLVLAGGELVRATLIDFGIAVGAGPTRVTAAGFLVGSAAYLSPERALGEEHIDARSDVYSLGCILFECLTGRRAHEGRHTTAVLAKILWEEPARPSQLASGVPPRLDDLIVRMMAKQRATRPADGAAVARELADLDGPSEAVPSASARSGGGAGDKRAPSAAINARLRAMLSPGHAAEPEVPDAAAAAAPPPSAATGAQTPDRDEAGAARAITHDEQRLAWVVAVGPLDPALEARAAETVAAFASRLRTLADGRAVALFAEAAPPVDQATRAARCAMAIAACAPGAPVAMAAGHAVISKAAPVAQAVDRAVDLLEGAPPGRVRVDDVTVALVSGHFTTMTEPGGSYLVRESPAAGARRTLLGKPTPFVGRDVELSLLGELYDECCSERAPRAVLVVAEAGMGKSRLRYELVRRLEEDSKVPPRVWLGRGDTMGTASAWATMAAVVLDAAGVTDGDDDGARRDKLAALLDRLTGPDAARIAAFLRDLCGVTLPMQDEQLRAARRDALLKGDQLRRALLDWLEAECARGPVLLVLEDLHWADASSVACVDAALRQLGGAPLFVLALARPDYKRRFEAPTSDRAPTRTADGPLPGAVEIRLRELSPRAGAQLTRAVLGDGVPEETVEELLERAEGNVFFLEELLRAVALGQGPELPPSVLATMQARLDALDPRGRRILRAASVLGRSFGVRDVAALIGEEAHQDVERWLEYLADRELCTADRRGAGGARYVFRHALVRDAAYASLTEADRTLAHRLAGQWLSRSDRGDAAAVADHLERGGSLEPAARWYRRAAEQALEGNDLSAVLGHAAAAMRCGAAGELTGEVALLRAVARAWRGEYAAAQADAQRALDALPTASVRWLEAVAELAVTSGRLRDKAQLEAAAAHLTGWQAPASSAAAGERSPQAALVIAAARTAMELFFAGLTMPTELLCFRIEVVPEAELADDPAAEAWALRGREIRAALGDDSVAELRCMQLAAERFGRAGDLRNAALMRSNIGHALTQLGAYAEAERELRAGIAAAERLNLSGTRAVAQHNLGLVLALRGALDEAKSVEETALSAVMEQGDTRIEIGARVYLSRIHLARGEVADAVAQARRACEMTPAPALELYCRAQLARSLVAAGEVGEGSKQADRIAELLDQVGGVTEGEALARLTLAEAWHAAGKSEALDVAARARERLLERARQIHDRARRESFLGAVPEHARTLALFDVWRATSE